MLETNRLRLRKMTAGDVDAIMVIFSDPEVMRSFGGDLFDRSQTEKWVDRNLGHQRQYGYGLFSVILKSDQTLVGDCGLEHMEVDGRAEVEIGYDFRSDYWGQGLATEAASAVRDFALIELGLPRVISLIRPDNIASRRVAEKIGMVKERDILRGGQTYWIYSLSSAKS
ncbi:MAG: GNAT family N-acetyltransferase [Candidatus Eisenbacteria bacterium]